MKPYLGEKELFEGYCANCKTFGKCMDNRDDTTKRKRWETCDTCEGLGIVGEYICSECMGSGRTCFACELEEKK